MAIPLSKKRLLSQLPDLMRGSITKTSRSCGKTGCKCQTGDKHPLYLFGYSIKGKKKILSVPAKSYEQIQKLINNWKQHKNLIEELTDINVQLIRKGKFNDKKE